jgi:hypothetical protein
LKFDKIQRLKILASNDTKPFSLFKHIKAESHRRSKGPSINPVT